jgi:integral membrane protein (TIGR01906 family)
MNRLDPRLAGVMQWVITLLMPIVLILFTLYIFMSPQFAEWEYARPDFPPADRFTNEQRLYNSVQTVHYVRGEISEQDLINLGVYNDREIKHLVDVYNVTRPILIIVPLSFVIIVLFLFLLWRNRSTNINAGRALFYGGILSFLLMLAIGLFAAFAFDSFFVTFHHVFFSGDSWLFNYSDSLIQFYPEVFWMAASYGMAGITIVCSILVTAIGAWIIRRSPAVVKA